MRKSAEGGSHSLRDGVHRGREEVPNTWEETLCQEGRLFIEEGSWLCIVVWIGPLVVWWEGRTWEEQGIFALNLITWCQSFNRLKQIVLLTSSMCREEDEGDIGSDLGVREWTTTSLLIDYSLTISWLQLGHEIFADTQLTTTWLHMTFLWAVDDLTGLSFLQSVTCHIAFYLAWAKNMSRARQCCFYCTTFKKKHTNFEHHHKNWLLTVSGSTCSDLSSSTALVCHLVSSWQQQPNSSHWSTLFLCFLAMNFWMLNKQKHKSPPLLPFM